LTTFGEQQKSKRKSFNTKKKKFDKLERIKVAPRITKKPDVKTKYSRRVSTPQ